MGVVTRNHLEAFILLLQDKFRSHRSLGCSGRRSDCVSVRRRHDSREGQSIHAGRGNGPAHENSQLARDAAEKLLFVALHTGSLFPQNPDSRNFTPIFDFSRQIIFL
jgi:hypothetical protein